MARYHCRCRQCETRKVLAKHPDEFTRLPKCPKESCGARDWRTDAWMNQRDTGLRGMGCACSGYHFPHRRGSKFCWYRQDGTQRMPGDADFNDRHMTDDEIAAAAAQLRMAI